MKSFTILMLCMCCVLSGCSYNNEYNIQDYEDKIEELENRIYDLELELKWEKEELDNCKTLLEDYENNDNFIPNFTDY